MTRNRGSCYDFGMESDAPNDKVTRPPRRGAAGEWAWLDRVTGPVDADFAAAATGSGSGILAEMVRFEGGRMWVGLSDGQVVGVPLTWFPRLLRAAPAEREGCEIVSFGLHWAALDEDVSVEGLLAGHQDRGRVGERWHES